MARTLDTPAPQPDAVQQAISGFRFETPHIRNDADTAMELSRPNILVWYEVITYDNAGSILYKTQRSVPFGNWPANFTVDAKAIYEKLAIDAENAGLILGPGTDELLE